MAGQVVQDDHIAFAQGRRELGLDVGIERRAVHGTVDDPGRVQPVVAQRRDKRLRAPVAEGRVIDQPLPARRPAGGLGHVGFQPGFVNEANAFQHMRHEGLAVHDPDMPLAGHLGALLLKRLNVFFCVSARAVGTAARPNWDLQTHHAQPASVLPFRRA